MDPWLIEALIGLICRGRWRLAVLIIGLLIPHRSCPDCGDPFPRFRKPANRSQAQWGGATCARCACEVDRRGWKIENP